MGERVSTRGTVLIAGAANLLVGAIKLAAGIMVGSSAMLAETAHSAADTLNQGLLLASLRRGDRPADSRHPFGYGQERYFWSLLAVAVRLGLDSRDYLIGHPAAPRELAVIRAEIEDAPGVDALLRLRTMYLGPDHLIVAAQVAFDDEISADQAEDIADRVDRRLSDRLPLVPHVFLDPTQASSGPQGVKT
jgi:divalent metal cation (Fe/Co/Zn/Cd) transporter